MRDEKKHIETLAWILIEEGLGRETSSLLPIVNFEWEMRTFREFTSEDIVDARLWIYSKMEVGSE